MCALMTPQAFTSMSYDYLIAGGGTAGLVLANRLTEIPSVSVGVIEAGADLTNDTKVKLPLYMFDMQGNPKYDWNFSSVPQADLDGLRVSQARGKMLGGSSGINYMQFTVASRSDLDDWETLGNSGWNYESLAPYYKKFEHFQGARPEINRLDIDDYIVPSVHGDDGPIATSFSPYYTNIQLAWTPTLRALGLQPNGDPRDGVSLGGYTNPMFMSRNTAQRSFAGNEYYQPFKERPNLHVITGALVSNVIFDRNRDSELTAVGLNFTVDGKSYIANATKEVIVSGGTMKSPQMLELSGIGDSKILKKFGIETLIDNPNVGENFQDHPQCGVPFVPNDGETTFDQLYNDTLREYWTRVYETNQTGMLTSGITQTAQLSWRQILSADKKDRPAEVVRRLYNSKKETKPGLKEQRDLQVRKIVDENEQNFQTGTLPGIGTKPKPGQENKVMYIGGFVAHPLSRGFVHIKSADPNDDPEFDPRYLSHPLDYEMLKDAVLFNMNISTTAPMSTLLKGNGTVHPPSLPVLNESTVKGLINTGFGTSWHILGSCAMMPKDKGGVVDAKLKVYGTKNLRVVDASIAPLQVRGNTCSLTYAIAEKAADIIKDDNPAFASGNCIAC
ncbi:MAG: hypothetical protein M1817_004940 [Caeruleum heppii]|nr:MAG: hypothetical protein M1817_004940 [Caeruleum heppii]